jgi:HAMP domain-containing protein
MTQRNWLALLLLALGGGFSLFLFLSVKQDEGVTLAELAPDSHSSAAGSGFSFVAGLESGARSLAGLGLEPIFYGVLGLCGLVLALRVVISVFHFMHEERSVARQQPASRVMDAPRQVGRAETPGLLPAKSAIAKPKTAPAPVATPLPAAAPRSAIRLRDQVPRSTHGPVARLMFAFAGIVAALGMLATALVYFRLTSALSEHALQRARVTAVNVSDSATPYLFKNNASGLRELLRKQANRPDLAYVIVEDRAKRIFAHSFASLPGEVTDPPGNAEEASHGRRLLRIGGNAVYEVAVPISEGRSGTVRVGIWRARVDDEINQTVIPLTTWLACVVIGGVLAAMFLAWRINRPIFKLVSVAKAISRGDLDTPTPNVGDAGEFGELSRALERLRSSVKAALIRLDR